MSFDVKCWSVWSHDDLPITVYAVEKKDALLIAFRKWRAPGCEARLKDRGSGYIKYGQWRQFTEIRWVREPDPDFGRLMLVNDEQAHYVEFDGTHVRYAKPGSEEIESADPADVEEIERNRFVSVRWKG